MPSMCCGVRSKLSTKWWHRVCGSADGVLQVNKKINFLKPNNDPKNHNTLGSSLVAYGPRGVAALRNAARNGLGTLFVPYAKFQPPPTNQAASYLESNSENERLPSSPFQSTDIPNCRSRTGTKN